jgi:hypothetical protein|tara:strand:- start:90 stop:254 length:165 start_codon:yes stop_codon:yes gene_type:complete
MNPIRFIGFVFKDQKFGDLSYFVQDFEIVLVLKEENKGGIHGSEEKTHVENQQH